MARVFACKATELSPGEIRQVEVTDRRPIAIYNVAGDFFATDDTCTHGEASLSDGYLEGTTIECPYHGGAFDVRTGEPTSLPCMEAIACHAVIRLGEDLFIEIAEEQP